MKLIVGLGNPGKEYEGTPHNVGFAAIDVMAQRCACRLRKSFRFGCRLGQCSRGVDPLLLVKPETFMNRSGEAVQKILRYWKLTPQELILVLDDADLALGRIRLRPKGSSGGHKGLASVIQHVGSDAFVRVRIGVGRGSSSVGLVEHVLAPFSAAEKELAQSEVLRASDAVECLLDAGIETAMNRFNSSAGADE